MKVQQSFLTVLTGLLLGLMFFDKPFAYLGIGPVFITELVLLLGLAVMVMSRRDTSPSNWNRLPRVEIAVFAIFLAYEAIRTAFNVPHYRVLALRDGVVWGYALFAIIIVSLIDKDTLQRHISRYRRIAPLFAAWAPIAVLLYAWRPGHLTVPGRSISLYLFKPGDLLVHLAGVGAALALWPRSTSARTSNRIVDWVVSLLWGAGFIMAASLSRGGLLACLAGLAVVAVLAPPKKLLRFGAGAIVAFLLLSISGLQINCPAIAQGALNKEISAQQVVRQIKSMTLMLPRALAKKAKPVAPKVHAKMSRTKRTPVNHHVQTGTTTAKHGRGGHAAPTSGIHTVQAQSSRTPQPSKAFRLTTIGWRLNWWKKIVGYTIGGPYLLTGKGFGINLADADGFQPQKNHGLRDPHNVFMTFLARSGVPGLVLFVILAGTVLVSLFITWRRSDENDRKVAAWLLTYLTAILVNACFDVYIENPMGGVWFWSLLGAAIVLTAGRQRAETSM